MDIEQAVSRAEEIVRSGYSIEDNWVEFQDVLLAVTDPPKPHPQPPTHEQQMRLYRIAVDLLLQGFPAMYKGVPTHQMISGMLYRTDFQSPFSKRFRESLDPDIELSEKEWQLIDIVRHMVNDVVKTVSEGSESITYIDSASTEIGGYNRLRSGYVVTTKDRLFMIGQENVADTKYSDRFYILYPDLETKPYYGSLDYIYLDNIKDVRLDFGRMDKKITIDLHELEFAKMKPRYLLGPLFFKAQRDDKVKKQIGPFRLTIRIPKPREQSKEFYQNRFRKLLSVLTN